MLLFVFSAAAAFATAVAAVVAAADDDEVSYDVFKPAQTSTVVAVGGHSYACYREGELFLPVKVLKNIKLAVDKFLTKLNRFYHPFRIPSEFRTFYFQEAVHCVLLAFLSTVFSCLSSFFISFIDSVI